jgi:hypothetical protein
MPMANSTGLVRMVGRSRTARTAHPEIADTGRGADLAVADARKQGLFEAQGC